MLAQHQIIEGSPRFLEPGRTRAEPSSGSLTDWREALFWDPKAVLACTEGDFAVGLRDATGRVLLAVDRFGMHTICYRILDGELHFAQRADELAAAGDALDEQALYDFLYFHAIPSPRTVYRDVRRLPPGHFAVFEAGRLTVAPYWTPTFNELQGRSFADWRDEFRTLLAQSVKAQLGEGTPACFLSGGTDSSTVAGMIREVTGEAPDTYSIGFEAQGYDEMHYARLASKHFRTRHHEYYVTPEDLVQGIPAAAKSFDQPFGNSSVLPTYCCARLAQGDGVTRLLAGDGGDELFGGNSRYAKQRIFGWYDRLPATLRSSVLEPALLGTALGRLPLARKGASYIEQARVPMPDRLQTYNLLQRLGPADVLTPGFLARVDTGDPLQQQRAVWSHCEARSGLDRNLAFDWCYTLAENDLPKVRMACALAGVAPAFPLLDSALLEFSQRLPTNYKLRGLSLRWFFKEALRGFLPDEIIGKQKHGFGLPFGIWATQHAALASLAADSLRSLGRRGLVRPAFIEQLITSRLPEQPGYYGEMVWILMMLEQWLQQHAPNYALRD